MEKQTHWKTIADMPYLGAYALVGKKELVLTIKDIKQELVIGNAGTIVTRVSYKSTGPPT